MLSILATHNPDGTVQGIDNLQAQFAGSVRPRRLLAHRSGHVLVVPVHDRRRHPGRFAAFWFLWRMRKGRTPGRGAVLIAVVLPLLPLAANSFAWIFTEMGRQPWIVYGQQLTSNGVSPNVGTFEVGHDADRLHAPLRRPCRGGGRAAGQTDPRPLISRAESGTGDSADRPAPFAY
jgi:cytochrome d ubiquinol oxidase subunit I